MKGRISKKLAKLIYPDPYEVGNEHNVHRVTVGYTKTGSRILKIWYQGGTSKVFKLR